MHELPVTQSILDIALRHAGAAGARRITGLHLAVGQLSTIVDDSVQFYWESIARGTLAEGSTLHFRRIPAILLCLDCGTQYGLNGREMACPSCDSRLVKIVVGEEFSLEAIDVDEVPEGTRT